MRIETLDEEEVFASLRTSAKGLSAEEAARRQKEFGFNRVERVQQKSVVWKFLAEFTHFFAILLWSAAGLSFFAEYRDPGGGMGTLGVAIIGVIVVNGVFSFWQEHRAEQAIAALEKLLPEQTRVLRPGSVTSVLAEELVPGDVVLLEAGDRVPADARVIEAFALQVNASTLTGESVPVSRTKDPCAETSVIHARNIVLAGTTLASGNAKVVVFATGTRTEFGKIARLSQETEVAYSPLQREVQRVSRLVAVLATVLGVVFFLAGQALGLPLWQNLLFAVGILVANVPEGLLPTVTLALAMGSQRMAKRNALVRHLPAVETLGSTTVICTDKTGTLTQNKMEVRELFVAGETVLVTDAPRMQALAREHRRVFEIAAHCHSLRDGALQRSLGDPMELALVRLAYAAIDGVNEHEVLDEFPFDSDRRRASVVLQKDSQRVLFCKGAPEVVLSLSQQVRTASGEKELSTEEKAKIEQTAAAMASRGLRVLALAYRVLPADCVREEQEQALVFAGFAAFLDPPRPEVFDAVKRCQSAGLRVVMVTGDHPLTACAIARELSLVGVGVEPKAITGEELRKWSEERLQLALDATNIVFARVDADQKARVVEVFKRKGHIVAVTGDGVNDAPALRAAHLGIAMGKSGTDVAREAAQLVLADDNFASIVNAIEEGRAVFENLRKFLTYILTSNVPELVPYLAFVLLRVPLALTVVQILAIDLGTDLVPALALGAEPPDASVMERPPRKASQRLFDRGLALRAYVYLGFFEAAGAMFAFFYHVRAGGWQWGQTLGMRDHLYREATTACLVAVVVVQVFNLLACRSERGSSLRLGLRGNRLLLVGIVVELVLVALLSYTSIGNALFGTAPLPWHAWFYGLPFGVLLLLTDELRKRWSAASRSLGAEQL